MYGNFHKISEIQAAVFETNPAHHRLIPILNFKLNRNSRQMGDNMLCTHKKAVQKSKFYTVLESKFVSIEGPPAFYI